MSQRLFRIGLISCSLAASTAFAQQRPYHVEQHDGDLLLFELETGNNWVYEAKSWQPLRVPGKMNPGMMPAEMHQGGLNGSMPSHHPGHPNFPAPPMHPGAGSHGMQPQPPFPAELISASGSARSSGAPSTPHGSRTTSAAAAWCSASSRYAATASWPAATASWRAATAW